MLTVQTSKYTRGVSGSGGRERERVCTTGKNKNEEPFREWTGGTQRHLEFASTHGITI